MHVGDLPAHEPTDEDILRIANRTGEPENLVTLRVAPPAPVDGGARHGLRKVGDRPARAFQDDAVAPDESEGSLGSHCGVDSRRSLTYSRLSHRFHPACNFR